MRKNRTRPPLKPRFSDAELEKFELSFYNQLPTVAGLLSQGMDAEGYDEIARASINLINSLLDELDMMSD
jgi:hypothetical protein